jgi:hypothetical protein
MNKFITFLIIQFCLTSLNAQNRISIYGNAGTAIITNFDYKPSISAYGDLGIKYSFYKGLSVSLEASSILFKQSTDISKFIANYYTQTNGLGLVLLHETPISQNWYLGVGAGVSVGMFSGRVYAQNEPVYFLLTGLSDIRLKETITTYKGLVNFRRILNKHFDAQIGLSFNYAQSNFLDMYTELNNKKNDVYTVLYAGFLFKLSKGHKNSKSLKCPTF